MKEGLATKKHPDPHDWREINVDMVVRGTHIVVKQVGKGWICKKCRRFTLLDVDKWNPYYPDMFPCKEKQNV